MIKLKASVVESTTSPENLVGYQEIDLHMIFDISLGGGIMRKYRLAAGGTQVKRLSSITYSSVVL